MVDKRQQEYLEVSLGKEPRIVTGIGTQGRFANGVGAEFTPTFTLEFTRPGKQEFVTYAFPPDSNEVSVTVFLLKDFNLVREVSNKF